MLYSYAARRGSTESGQQPLRAGVAGARSYKWQHRRAAARHGCRTRDSTQICVSVRP